MEEVEPEKKPETEHQENPCLKFRLLQLHTWEPTECLLDETPSSLVYISQLYGGTCYFYLQRYTSARKTEETFFSKMLVNMYQIIRHHISDVRSSNLTQ
jgi:hypothetical protein